MRAAFVDANPALRAIAERLAAAVPEIEVTYGHADATREVLPDDLPALMAGAGIAVIDHTALPVEIARRCTGLGHVVFLGTGTRSYMNPEALAAEGISVDVINGYGDVAVAEHAIALLFAAARGIARMDGAMREGRWLRTEGMQLAGKTLGLVGFGGIAAEVARVAQGIGMRVLAWNRSPKTHVGVEFMSLDDVLAHSHAVSLHLLLTDATRGLLTREKLASMRPGAILVNTARGALVDEAALVAALRSGQIGHAALDVFDVEPLPAGHVLATLPNVTLSAHSGFRTPEANERLIEAAFVHCKRLADAAAR